MWKSGNQESEKIQNVEMLVSGMGNVEIRKTGIGGNTETDARD